MSAARLALAFSAVVAAVCSAALPARASDACPTGQAGIAADGPAHGIGASLEVLTTPEVAAGEVSAWIGMAPRQGRPWVRVGFRTTSRGSNQLFYEIAGKHRRRRAVIDAHVSTGARVRVALMEMRKRPGYWRVWARRRPVTRPLDLSEFVGSSLLTAAAEGDAARSETCNSFAYRFRTLSLVRHAGERWRALRSEQIFEDPGYQVIRQTQSTFVARTAAPAQPRRFKGDFETGDHGQWAGLQHRQGAPESDQFEIVADPVRQGRYAARFTVRPEDRWDPNGGERAEVWWPSRERPGESLWYSWSTLFPTTWTAPNEFGIFMQWHSGLPVPPVIAFDAREDTLQVKMNTGEITTGRFAEYRVLPLLDSLHKGQWNDFVVHVVWSKTATGSITVWHRLSGEPTYRRVLDLGAIPTLQFQRNEPDQIYLKLGLYRWGDPTKTDVIYQDAFRRANSLSEFNLSPSVGGQTALAPSS